MTCHSHMTRVSTLAILALSLVTPSPGFRIPSHATLNSAPCITYLDRATGSKFPLSNYNRLSFLKVYGLIQPSSTLNLTINDLYDHLNHKDPDDSKFNIPFTLKIRGYVQSVRRINSQDMLFIDINDGSSFSDLQIVVPQTSKFENLDAIRAGDDLEAVGSLDYRRGKPSERALSQYDLHIDHLNDSHELVVHRNSDSADPNPVLPNQEYSDEYLRKYPHLRFQNKQFANLLRIQTEIVKFIFDFFSDKGFYYIQTPALTRANCESIQCINVQTPKTSDSSDVSKGSNNEGVSLILSPTGQMELEAACYGVGRAWKFGPSFRAETSNTNRHSYEFAMIEAEWPNATLEQMIGFIEELIRSCASYLLEKCKETVNYTNTSNTKYNDFLTYLSTLRIKVITYDEAIDILNTILMSHPEANRHKFKPVTWGKRLTDSNEKALVEHFGNQIIAITNYPESITAFYMKDSEWQSGNEAHKTVENFDIIAPFGYEIAGGSVREHEYDALKRKMERRNIVGEDYDRYLKLRKYRYLPHGGFGIGLDRLVMLMTMKDNIRDVVPFPSTNL